MNQAADVVRLWNDPKTLPDAHYIWKKVKPRLLALLKEAEGPKLGINASEIKKGRDAVANITKYLSGRDARIKMDEAVKAFQAPDVSEALDLQKVKQFEPTLDYIRSANKQLGRAAKDTKLGDVAKVIEIYYKVDSLKEKLQAFRDAGLLKQAQTAADMVAFLEGITVDALEAYTKAAKALAEKAGEKALAEQLGDKLKVLKKIKGALAIYSAIKSAVELVQAIESGDPHAIAAAARNFTIAVIDVAESFGVISAGGAATATGAIVVVWATAEAIMMAAELAHWFRDQRALDAVKSMLAQGKKVIPYGKEMAAATVLMIDAQNSQDEGSSAEFEFYENQANKMAVEVAKGTKALASHVQGHDLDSVGGYPKLVAALGPAAGQLIDIDAGIIPSEPLFLTDAFEIILKGIKNMVTVGTAEYGK